MERGNTSWFQAPLSIPVLLSPFKLTQVSVAVKHSHMEIATDELSLLPVLLYLLTIVPHHQGGRGQNVALHSWNRS